MQHYSERRFSSWLPQKWRHAITCTLLLGVHVQSTVNFCLLLAKCNVWEFTLKHTLNANWLAETSLSRLWGILWMWPWCDPGASTRIFHGYLKQFKVHISRMWVFFSFKNSEYSCKRYKLKASAQILIDWSNTRYSRPLYKYIMTIMASHSYINAYHINIVAVFFSNDGNIRPSVGFERILLPFQG